jgi:integrase
MIERGQFWVRAKFIDPRTGEKKEVNKRVEAASAHDAAAIRADLMTSAEQASSKTPEVRVTDFAKLWTESKAALVDDYTIDGYTSALENHVLPSLGKYYYSALRPADVQAWVNEKLSEKKKDGTPKYAVKSVNNWFRVFRNMTRDAIVQLDLPRDPTTRITFPDGQQRDGNNALSPEQLSKFLGAMRADYPGNYALAATLAFTGLRFCHASALKWEDIDEEKGIVRIQRKQKVGIVGPVSKRKRAPKELPLPAELAEILREHRSRLLKEQSAGLDEGWVFPSRKGTLRTVGSLVKAWRACCETAGIKERFTIHGLRRTLNDLTRRAGVDAVITKSITGHVTEQMREHYSSVAIDEKRQALAAVVKLVPLPKVEPKVEPAAKTRSAG